MCYLWKVYVMEIYTLSTPLTQSFYFNREDAAADIGIKYRGYNPKFYKVYVKGEHPSAKKLEEFYSAWPGGLEEIEAALSMRNSTIKDALNFVKNLRVPQNIAEAGMQVWQGAQLINRMEKYERSI